MPQYAFGSAFCFGVRTDVANSSPVPLGVLQDISMDFSADLKGLYGNQQYPLAFGRGKSKVEIKAKAARLLGSAFNSLYFGATTSVGQMGLAVGESGVIPTSAGFTLNAANAANFAEDWGVIYAATGVVMTRVAAAPAVGQYAVSAGGVYTFNTADQGLQVYLNYRYTVAGSGTTISISNPVMGACPQVALWIPGSYQGKAMTTRFNNCASGKLSFPTKQDDWLIPELSFEAAADAGGNVATMCFAE